MHLKYNDTHIAFRSKVRDFLENDIVPFMNVWNNQNCFPRKLFEMFSEKDILGIMIPKEKGGLGLDFSYSFILMEEIMKIKEPSLASSLLIQINTVCPLLYRYGSEYIHESFLKPIIRSEMVAGLAATEPEGGSDLINAIQCYAERDGDNWVINGEKMFITNAPIADVLIVFARTGKARVPLSMTFIAVPTSTQGIEIEDQRKLGQRASQIGKIKFKNCIVPFKNTVGKVNQGYIYFSNVFFEERLLIACGAVALAQCCFEDTVKFARSRIIGGIPLIKHQAVAHELSFMAAELESCKAFVHKIVGQMSEGGKVDRIRTCMAKYCITEKAQKIVKRCVQLHGSECMIEGTWMEQVMRDMRVLSVYAGSSETMRELASKSLQKLYIKN